ncbi:TetR/AcrR family transcriptional regulator [Telmatospirillum siberiense]|uniref:TetR/AcrR family transcriptional regulator n=1 Tax=Telmatospirillum siberiense TaxID=382514 RepID=A0A2N3PX56_9PROT|nr:TetR/AcrR family transcriptional regulator [Telmatospirillum siberiense]PKU24986.1 TetR/AcrR family transcriptional regulator [Telmatospirillum siberiense]
MRRSSPLSASVGLSARDRILRAAQDLFYLHGVRATGIDRVIAEAGVTKVTFYRHFPSKDDLIRAYLRQRHETWIAWFKESLAASRASQSAADRRTQPLMPVLQVAREWFHASTFRGCAFANTVAEIGESVPSITGIALQHKQAVRDAIADLLPSDVAAAHMAWAATLALDGAIVNAQLGGSSTEAALLGLQHLLHALACGYCDQGNG